MKKTLFLLLWMFTGVLVFGQSAADKQSVLMQCFAMPALQNYYPVNNLGQPAPLYVMEHGMSFYDCRNLIFAGHGVNFLGKDEMQVESVPAFFLFNTIEITPEGAFVKFSFYYQCSITSASLFNAPHIMVEGNLLRDSSGNWYFTESKTERRNS